MRNSIDVTGLTEEAVQKVEILVELLRSTSRLMPSNLVDPQQWSVRLRNWATSHPSRDIVIDDSRESIYAGRGE